MIFKTAIVFLLVCIAGDTSKIREALKEISKKGSDGNGKKRTLFY